MAQIIGIFRIGKDAEIRYIPSGDAVCNLSLAFNYGKKEHDGKPTQWIDAALFGKRAEAMAPYLLKGGMIYAVISDPHIETYEGKNGPGSKLVGKVIEIEFAGSKSHDAPAKPSAPSRPAAPAKPAGGGTGFDDMDDDIPFISNSCEHDMQSRLARRMRKYL